MRNFLDSILNWIADNFRKDASKMLIVTGIAGWALSSAAQICGILFNPKIPNEQKGYLLPQEFADAAVNIGAFFAITQLAKGVTSKLFKTGKFAPKSVKEFIKLNENKIGKQIGNLKFDLGKVLQKESPSLYNDFKIAHDFATTAATIAGGVISTNVVTPIVRNKMATNMQKKYIDYKNLEENNQPTFKALQTRPNYSGSLRI